MSDPFRLTYGNAGDKLTVKFEPEAICMLPSSGRVYHPGPSKAGGVGLIKSSLAIELSNRFGYDNDDVTTPPVTFEWEGKIYNLKNDILKDIDD